MKPAWDALKLRPALRAQVVEIVAVRSCLELSENWCFGNVEECRNYVRGPLIEQIRRDAPDAVSFVLVKFGERAI